MSGGVISQMITKKLTEVFKPRYLNVINESHMHNVPKEPSVWESLNTGDIYLVWYGKPRLSAGSETHFKVVVVSELFSNKALIQRHRLVNETLKDELASGVHALSIQAKTPEQWDSSEQKVPVSPPCMGGSKR